MSVHVSVSEGESEDQAITPTPQKATAEKVWFKLAGCRLQVAVNWLKSSNVLDIIAELNTNSPKHIQVIRKEISSFVVQEQAFNLKYVGFFGGVNQ